MKARILKSQSGFSLIELMIVVAIIGILATVAIPNFNRFQAKAKQSEAKANLSALYSAEKAFFAEWNQYFADFRDIGYQLEGKMVYATGFQAAGVAAPAAPYSGATAAGGAATCFNTSGGCTPNAQLVTGAPAIAAVAAGNCGAANVSSAPTATTFGALARGDLRATGGVIDQWTINERKVLCNNVPGIN